MKRNIIALVTITVITAWSFVIYLQVGKLAKGATQNLTFNIYKGVNYASEAYNNTTAKVQIVVEKVSKHKREVVYQQNLAARELKQYPDLKTAEKQKISIPGIDPKKDKLEVKYILTYDSNGSQMSMQYGEEVGPKDNGHVDIKI